MTYVEQDKERGLFDYEDYSERVSSYSRPLDRLASSVDFELFREVLLRHLDYSDQSKGGRRPYDPVLMFKVLVLQKYHCLSEEECEFQLLDRESFRRFVGLGLRDRIPDKNTIWSFKQRLGEEAVSECFELLTSLLETEGLIAKEGMIVDAAFVEVPRQRKRPSGEETAGEGPGGKAEAPNHRYDREARWGAKHKRFYYGYKNHIKVRKDSKLVARYEVSAANEADIRHAEPLLDPRTDESLYGDKAYCSGRLSAFLEQHGIADQIHRKDRRSPFGYVRANNKGKSRIRGKVEHVFGFQTNSMKADRIRTRGIKRARFQIGLSNLIYNLCRIGQLGWSLKA